MNLYEILLESRIDDFKEKFGRKFNSSQMERLIKNVPQKYLLWVGKHFETINFDENIQKLIQSLNKFDKISSNLTLTDINQYKSLEQLFQSLEEYQNRPKRQVRQVEGGNVVFEDNKFFVVNPLNHQASCYYGRGTKWCTAADSDYQFKQYNDDGKLFYLLDKTKSTDDPLYKIALLRKFNGEKTFFDAQDNKINNVENLINSEYFKQIMSSIDDYLNTEFAGQVKIFNDMEFAKKERQRIEQLRIQRVLESRREDAQIRRDDNEWALGPDCPEEGLKAHALLDWLVDTSDVQVMTNDDRLDLQRLIDEKERLETEYDEDEDVRRDILDRIDEIDEEIEEIRSKIDVYNIIPTDNFYDCTEFEVIDGGLSDRRYAVGTDSEMKSSAYDYVDNLIDDIGYEGFNKSFVQNYIDSDAVADEAERIYDDDVRDNPEVYLDESDRQLSDEQVEEIEILKMKIQKNKNFIESLEQESDDEDESISEKIEEFNELNQEYEDEIESIENDPQGEFPDDLIEDKVQELVSEVRRNPEWFLSEFGLDWKDFIDKDDFIDGVIDEDGYGHTLNSYDGNADEVYVQNELFYVMRID